MDFKGGVFVGNALLAVMNGLPEHILNKFVWTVEAAKCQKCGEADVRVYPFVFLRLEEAGFLPNSVAKQIKSFEVISPPFLLLPQKYEALEGPYNPSALLYSVQALDAMRTSTLPQL